MDPEVIVISDEELEEENSINDIDENEIVISDEEMVNEYISNTSTPELSISSYEIEDSDLSSEPLSSIDKYLSSDDSSDDSSGDDHNSDILKRKCEQVIEELDTEEKKFKSEPEAEVQNIKTVHEMITECKKMMSLSSKVTLSVGEGKDSKDVNYDSSEEINPDDKPPIQENTIKNAK